MKTVKKNTSPDFTVTFFSRMKTKIGMTETEMKIGMTEMETDEIQAVSWKMN
jgi:hypothetical protein